MPKSQYFPIFLTSKKRPLFKFTVRGHRSDFYLIKNNRTRTASRQGAGFLNSKCVNEKSLQILLKSSSN